VLLVYSASRIKLPSPSICSEPSLSNKFAPLPHLLAGGSGPRPGRPS
jgi:hypothetical protein